MKFLIYSERPANVESILKPLKDIFWNAEVDVVECNSTQIHNGILREKDTVGFCLPGILGEDSAYTDQLGENGLREMSESVSEGRAMLAICAGAYFIARETLYTRGILKHREPLNYIFNGKAQGPVPYIGGPYNPEWPSDLALVEVFYKTSFGRNSAKIAYGNGPMLYADPQDTNIEPLAHYAGQPLQPLAAASVIHGKGKILMLGVLPHIGHREVADYRGMEKIRKLLSDMKEHEDERHQFMSLISGRLLDQVLTYRQKLSI